MSGTPRGHLRLKVVGPHLIDIAAVGAFDESLAGDIAGRLERLLAGGPGRVHIDCSQIASIDPAVAEVFARACDRLRSAGGELAFSDAPPALRMALPSHVTMAHQGLATDTPAAVAS